MGINKILLGLLIIIIGKTKPFSDSAEKEMDKVTGISLIKEFPIVNWDSSLNVLESFYDVYYYEDYIMYKLNYEFDSSVNDEMILHERRYYFLVFHKDSLYAYKYLIKPSDQPATERINRDSILKISKFESDVYDTLLNFKPDSIYNRDDKIVKIYKNPLSAKFPQQPENFDLYFYYSKELKDIPETLSKKMDNVSGMKLCKIKVAARGGFYKEYNMTFPPREYSQEMKGMTIENEEEILGYFKKYRGEHL